MLQVPIVDMSDNTNTFRKFIPFNKMDAFQGIVTGVAASQAEDRDGECMDYSLSVPQFKLWSDEVSKATGGKSLGNIREQHNTETAAGKALDISFDDATKSVVVTAKIVDPIAKMKLYQGLYTGYSIGGSYKKQWVGADGKKYYVPEIAEISIVDMPCNPDAHFTAVKSDGSTEVRKFAKTTGEIKEVFVVAKADATITESKNISEQEHAALREFEAEGGKVSPELKEHIKGEDDGVVDNDKCGKAVRYLVPDGKHLPVSDESGKLSHRLMGAAWAALHGGYRGNKYEGADKDKAISELTSLYSQEKMPTPGSAKVVAAQELYKNLEAIENAAFEDGTIDELSTSLTRVAKLLDQLGDKSMSDELNKGTIKSAHAHIKALRDHLDGHKAKMDAHFAKCYKAADGMGDGKDGFVDHLDGHSARCDKAHKASHDHLDKLAKVLGGGPEMAEAEPANVKEDAAEVKAESEATKAQISAEIKKGIVAGLTEIFKGIGAREEALPFNKSAVTKTEDNGSKGNTVAEPTKEDYVKAMKAPMSAAAGVVLKAQESRWQEYRPAKR